ncbi:MAG TPA: hypothetical protein VI731_03340 [Bacteroidia bacterium]|nr:hypothetical protein [Bacteroidia bacterium]
MRKAAKSKSFISVTTFMGKLSETRENLKKEIAKLLEKTSDGSIMAKVSGEKQHEIDMLLADLATLSNKIAALRALLDIPEEENERATLLEDEQSRPEAEATPQEVVQPEIELPRPEIKIEVQKSGAGKPYPDLRSMIGFNERIMFQRDLFENKNSTYEEALTQLNGCISYEEAAAILTILQNRHSWKDNREPVQIFKELVKRRFS